MLSIGIVIAFALGMAAGFLLTLFVWHCGIKTASKEFLKHEEEKERRDPANWWKYGGDPHGDDDDRRGGLA